MSIIEIIGGSIIMICAVIIVIAVMSQEGKQGGAMNALSGGNDSSYLGHNKNRSNQAMLIRFTKYTGIVFVGVTLAVYLITSILGK